jgi:molybdopterin-guanine dinucleotide biosynthesis adapter protein
MTLVGSKALKAIGFAGFSGSGKTTLIEALIPLLKSKGLSVSLIKHAHHGFDVDVPGKDSYRHREAGAQEVLVTSDRRWALMHELRGVPEPTFQEHLNRLAPCDLVIVEGFKKEPFAKIEVRRKEHNAPLLAPYDPWIIAIATDLELHSEKLPILNLNKPDEIAEFLVNWIKIAEPTATQEATSSTP